MGSLVLKNRSAVLAFVGPALLIYSVVLVAPILVSVGYTFFEGGIIGGFTFVGTDNYSRLVDDAAFWEATQFTIKYALLATIGQVGFGLLLALMYVFWIRRASGLVRTLVFFPVVLPTVAVAQLFAKLVAIAPQHGLVNAGLAGVGLDELVRPWLGQANTAFWVIVVMDVWRAMGFYAVILFAGLVDVPSDVVDAARIDGASGGRLVRRIIIPYLKPILLSSVIFAANGTLKVFDSVVALTNGGPGQSTTPLTVYMYKTAFNYLDYGYGSTIAMALALMGLIVTILIFRFTRTGAV